MKSRILTTLALLVLCTGLSGCGGPPKDEARKLLFSYLERDGVMLEDIKYVSSYSKEGGYTVNLMAGNATCEMPTLKVDGKWIAKGMTCNGSFFTAEQAKEHKKIKFMAALKEAIAKENAKLPIKDKDGASLDKITLEGSKMTWFKTSPDKFADWTDSGKKGAADDYKSGICSQSELFTFLENGGSCAINVTSSDGKPVYTATVAIADCNK